MFTEHLTRVRPGARGWDSGMHMTPAPDLKLLTVRRQISKQTITAPCAKGQDPIKVRVLGEPRGRVPNPDRGFRKDFCEDVISELYVEGGVEIHPMNKAQTGNLGRGHRMCSSLRHLLCARHCL